LALLPVGIHDCGAPSKPSHPLRRDFEM
jgi:hypothetical protein